MPRQLSSHWTLFTKVLLPPLWIGLGVWLALEARDAGDAVRLALAALWLASGLFVVWLAVNLKQVWLEGDFLEIRGLRETLRVPLRDCEAVSGTLFLSPELISIRLRRPVAFGSRVVFLPRQRGFHPFSPHPLVARLRALIQAHEAPGLPPPLEAQHGGHRGLRTAALIALVLLAVAGLLVAGVTALLHTQNPYSLALERARSDPALVAALGEPIEASGLLGGRFAIGDEGDSAQLEIPVRGPRGDARLEVQAQRSGGSWKLLELRAELADGRSFDLLHQDEPPGELL